MDLDMANLSLDEIIKINRKKKYAKEFEKPLDINLTLDEIIEINRKKALHQRSYGYKNKIVEQANEVEVMDIDLSLDEIIAKNRNKEHPPRANNNHSKKFPPRRNNLQRIQHKPTFKPAHSAHIEDARNKIVAKQRAKILDARDVLVKSTRKYGFDARQRILERKPYVSPMVTPPAAREHDLQVSSVHKGRLGNRIITMGKNPGAVIKAVCDEPKPVSGKRIVPYVPKVPVPRGYVDYDNMQDLEQEEFRRTVDFTYPQLQMQQQSVHSRSSDFPRLRKRSPTPPPPPLHVPSSQRMQRMVDIWGNGKKHDVSERAGPYRAGGGGDGGGHGISSGSANDPFDVYEVRRNRMGVNLRDMNMDVEADANQLYERRSVSNLSSELRARLHSGVPDQRLSHGIYANENNAKKLLGGGVGGNSISIGNVNLHGSGNYIASGYRIVVSNLHADVSTDDIKELFSEIGPMYDARVVRPGTAEVIYKSLIDAERAVDTYHNRQLDGQPMTCMLVKPRSSNRPTAPAIGSQSAASVSCDIDTLHSVLFGER